MSTGLYGTSTVSNLTLQEAVDAAANSETNAAASEVNAATSESNASTSEGNAGTSETNAGASASAASTSESNAATSESNAATSESNAATSESNAATSESNAALEKGYAEEWAITVEDTLVSVAAGGNGTTDYSALHWAAKASAAIVVGEAPIDGTPYQRQDAGWVAGGSGSAVGRSMDFAQTGALVEATTWMIDPASIRTRPLPLSPTDGDEVGFADDSGLAASNNCLITVTGPTQIMGTGLTSFAITSNFARGVLKYYAAGDDWRLVP